MHSGALRSGVPDLLVNAKNHVRPLWTPGAIAVMPRNPDERTASSVRVTQNPGECTSPMFGTPIKAVRCTRAATAGNRQADIICRAYRSRTTSAEKDRLLYQTNGTAGGLSRRVNSPTGTLDGFSQHEGSFPGTHGSFYCRLTEQYGTTDAISRCDKLGLGTPDQIRQQNVCESGASDSFPGIQGTER